MSCCGASRRVGLSPKTAVLLGTDNGEPPQYLRVMESNFIPKVGAGQYVFVTGDAVEQALEEGKLQAYTQPQQRTRSKTNTAWRVTLPNGEAYDFDDWNMANKVSHRKGGKIQVINKEAATNA